MSPLAHKVLNFILGSKFHIFSWKMWRAIFIASWRWLPTTFKLHLLTPLWNIALEISDLINMKCLEGQSLVCNICYILQFYEIAIRVTIRVTSMRNKQPFTKKCEDNTISCRARQQKYQHLLFLYYISVFLACEECLVYLGPGLICLTESI